MQAIHFLALAPVKKYYRKYITETIIGVPESLTIFSVHPRNRKLGDYVAELCGLSSFCPSFTLILSR